MHTPTTTTIHHWQITTHCTVHVRARTRRSVVFHLHCNSTQPTPTPPDPETGGAGWWRWLFALCNSVLGSVVVCSLAVEVEVEHMYIARIGIAS
jgi:hypothetical protein